MRSDQGKIKSYLAFLSYAVQRERPSEHSFEIRAVDPQNRVAVFYRLLVVFSFISKIKIRVLNNFTLRLDANNTKG